ncbi:MAG: bifunctional nuclease family protein [Planctomycetes bacterium]|nr:bifunctional nuclease family protein [Planctomycetota bacterium]
MAMREVELARIIRNDETPECHLYLRELDGGRIFPIIIHQNEMAEIHRKVTGLVMRRPMTHDLFASLMQAAGLRLTAVEITELKSEVFYARMLLEGDAGQSFSLDARPSDAVAIATGVRAPLFASEKILDEIGVVEGAEDDTA